MVRLDLAQARALASLSREAGWSQVDRILTAELDLVLHQLMTAQEVVQIHQLQGRAKFIKDFRELVAQAPETVSKLTQSTSASRP